MPPEDHLPTSEELILNQNELFLDSLNDVDQYLLENRPRFQSIPVRQFSTLIDENWLIDDLIPQSGLGVIYGEPGCGKTFMALSAAFAIARGKPWETHNTSKGRVVYLCAEGEGGFRKRTHAYLKHHDLENTDIPLDVITEVPNFLDQVDITTLANAIGKASLIIVDTLSCVIAGGDENSGKDLGFAIKQCKLLQQLTGAFIILIHHSGKDAERGARGWSGLRGAVDTEIEVKSIGKSHRARITKQKDGEFGVEWGFDLNVIELGESSTGRLITSCVYNSTNAVPLEEKQPKKPSGIHQIKAMEIFSQYSVNNYLDYAEFISFVARETPYDNQESKRDTRRQHAKRAIDLLIEKEILGFDQNQVYKI